MKVKSMENDFNKLWIEDNIMFSEFSENLDMTEVIANECVKGMIELSGGLSYPVIFDLANLKSINYSARTVMAAGATEMIRASAMIAVLPVHKIMGNIFLTFNKPTFPVKLFDSKKEAQKWLEQYA